MNANARTKITTRELGDEQRATELMNTNNQVRTNNEGKKRKRIGKPKTATNNAQRERECKKRKGKKSKKLEQPERGSDRTKQKPGSCISPGHHQDIMRAGVSERRRAQYVHPSGALRHVLGPRELRYMSTT